MPAFVMNRGLELPIFDDLELPQALTTADIKKADELATDRFIRRIRCLPPTVDLPLKDVLRQTSETLQRAAELSGAVVLDHIWGLLSLDAIDSYYLGACIGSYGIVANVEVIRNATTPTVIQEPGIYQGMSEYGLEAGQTFRWMDRHLHQFCNGEGTVSGSALFLTDIDPVCEVNGVWPAIIHTDD